MKYLGSNDRIMKRKIFDQEQIARAVELGLGAGSPTQIDVVPADPQSRDIRNKIVEILQQG